MSVHILFDDDSGCILLPHERIAYEGAFLVIYEDASHSSDPVVAYPDRRVTSVDYRSSVRAAETTAG